MNQKQYNHWRTHHWDLEYCWHNHYHVLRFEQDMKGNVKFLSPRKIRFLGGNGKPTTEIKPLYNKPKQDIYDIWLQIKQEKQLTERK